MRKRKLQIFLSSTYEDLVDQRLAAMEAILAAGHIPAAMEQFSPGDETAWEKISAWIDESDAFILIVGGRYGSIEPTSGKSYVQLEYEYALEKKKPLFALVVNREHHEQRVREFGLRVDERDNRDKYLQFVALVTRKLCSFWTDKKDIKSVIFQKLPEWAQRSDLVGWVRADDAVNPQVTNELARLSQENNILRLSVSTEKDLFEGLSLEALIAALVEHAIPEHEITPDLCRIFSISITSTSDLSTLLKFFRLAHVALGSGVSSYFIDKDAYAYKIIQPLIAYGLAEVDKTTVRLTEMGRRFRNQIITKQS